MCVILWYVGIVVVINVGKGDRKAEAGYKETTTESTLGSAISDERRQMKVYEEGKKRNRESGIASHYNVRVDFSYFSSLLLRFRLGYLYAARPLYSREGESRAVVQYLETSPPPPLKRSCSSTVASASVNSSISSSTRRLKAATTSARLRNSPLRTRSRSSRARSATA